MDSDSLQLTSCLDTHSHRKTSNKTIHDSVYAQTSSYDRVTLEVVMTCDSVCSTHGIGCRPEIDRFLNTYL